MKDACDNCGTTKWAAKNDEYCTLCEYEYTRVARLTTANKQNPWQLWADKVLYENMPTV